MLEIDIKTYLNGAGNLILEKTGYPVSNATLKYINSEAFTKNSSNVVYNYSTNDAEIDEDDLKTNFTNYINSL